MATLHTRSTARVMMAPSVLLLFAWMIVPLVMTIYFSTLNYNLMSPGAHDFIGFLNYEYFVTDPAFWNSLLVTLLLVGGALIITVVGGIALALLLDQPIFGQGIVRMLVLAPFFVMPTVAALIWKHMFMNPVNGLLRASFQVLWARSADLAGDGSPIFDHHHRLLAVVALRNPHPADRVAVARRGAEGSRRDGRRRRGARNSSTSSCRIMARAITVVILIETIFLLSAFAEILVTTNGGPGTATTNLTYLVYSQLVLQQDVGGASAGGIIAVILANIVAIFLMRTVGKNLEA